MKAAYRGAQSALSIARLISAAFYGCVAALLISIALWLALPYGDSWLLDFIAILLGVQGATYGVKALELFLSTRPAEKPSGGQENPPRRKG